MDFFPLEIGYLSHDNVRMLSGSEIVSRVNSLALARGIQVPAKPKDSFRKVLGRDTYPSLPTLIECANVLNTSIAYLVGETDDPNPRGVVEQDKSDSPPLVLSESPRVYQCPDSDDATRAVALEPGNGFRDFALLPRDALLLADRLERAARDADQAVASIAS